MCGWATIALLCAALALLLALAGGMACRYAEPPGGARALTSARASLRACGALAREHPAVWRALDWRVTAGPESATDLGARHIQILVDDERGRAYDADTVRRVLAHELLHAALGSAAHDDDFMRREAAVVATLERGGVLEPGGSVDPFYPAQILATPT